MSLRRVTYEDRMLLLEWANDKEVRKNSFQTHQIGMEEHCRWLERKLADEQCDMFLLCRDDVPVGQIRLDYTGEQAVISYSIAKDYRGKGYGGILLQLAEDEVRRTRRDIHEMYAEVKEENLASRRKFEQAGYDKKLVFTKKLDGC